MPAPEQSCRPSRRAADPAPDHIYGLLSSSDGSAGARRTLRKRVVATALPCDGPPEDSWASGGQGEIRKRSRTCKGNLLSRAAQRGHVTRSAGVPGVQLQTDQGTPPERDRGLIMCAGVLLPSGRTICSTREPSSPEGASNTPEGAEASLGRAHRQIDTAGRLGCGAAPSAPPGRGGCHRHQPEVPGPAGGRGGNLLQFLRIVIIQQKLPSYH